ncbi:Fe-S cluster assembly ATPase SufC [Olsenella sp. YH-ols2217]|uniref:Fe-S cluster assembly ATPase SufC n=1 Tax=Kribbibacterium absianum TaxID=3044210 RepID=A0ABT6ZHP0_9ACTN|nr:MULTISPECIES: Fe-S cluster assembly ATPase SufC [unclassified Olsenella]MDJ1121075.1 Fe-S cluster assembly ATPase SufC [Olsenella sp. YH-ols2216]MDJ1128566.1 Fe-S cluster assembly ATPase SufC [Olsenella sp. YH-ols2217]
MAEPLLSVRDLTASADDKTILHGIDLAIDPGTCHVLMGPNGAGKSTLGHVLMGDPVYTVGSGTIEFAGEDVTDLSADKRSLAGMFLSFQAPVEIPGVPLYSFLRTICQKRPDLKMTARQFRKHVTALAEELEMDPAYLTRDLGVGFSGGEKKKVEMLQLLLLEPKLAILDETDSGLDVDALGVVSRGIAAYRERTGGALLVITHNTRILERLDVDETHVMVNGRIVANGDAALIPNIDANGFEQFEEAVAVAEAADATVMAENACQE